MKRLYHWPLDPAGRLVRLVLGEKGEAFELLESTPWAPHPDVSALAHGAVAPALVETGPAGKTFACGTRAICEQMEETTPTPALLPEDRNERAEARRLWAWVEAGCEEVTDKLLPSASCNGCGATASRIPKGCGAARMLCADGSPSSMAWSR